MRDEIDSRTYDAEETVQLGSRETLIVQAEIYAPSGLGYRLEAKAEYPPQ
jgi:hypothetical protein